MDASAWVLAAACALRNKFEAQRLKLARIPYGFVLVSIAVAVLIAAGVWWGYAVAIELIVAPLAGQGARTVLGRASTLR